MELFDLYNQDREPLDRTMVRGTPQPGGTYRLVVHICIFDRAGRMLIQRRQPFKYGWSGLWDLSVGGSVQSGETSRQAAERELREELGLRVSLGDVPPALTISFPDGFDDIYLLERELDPETLTLQYEEVAEAKWAEKSEILSKIEDGSFIPYHPALIELLFFLKDHPGTHTHADDTVPAPK